MPCLPFVVIIPGERNSTLIFSSFSFISSHALSTLLSRLASVCMKLTVPSGLSLASSSMILDASALLRPTRYTRGSTVCLTNSLAVVSPIPDVPPTVEINSLLVTSRGTYIDFHIHFEIVTSYQKQRPNQVRDFSGSHYARELPVEKP